MIVAELELRDFRNYAEARVELGPGPRLFLGPNGQGKTNLVESIVYLSTLSSHRVSTDHALIRTGQDSAIVRARLQHGERSVLVELQLNRTGANRAQLNRGAIKPRELPRHVAAVLFAPEDLALVRGEPSGRRRYLDELAVQLSPRLAGVLSDYDRVLRQRNTLLKSARGMRYGRGPGRPARDVRSDGRPPGGSPSQSPGEPEAETTLSTLDLWDERLVTLGSELIAARLDLVARLRPGIARDYAAIAGSEHSADLALRLSILGATGDDDADPEGLGEGIAAGGLDRAAIEEAFRAALAARRREERDRGITLVGPHRDDLVLTLNSLPARGYASHGESWSFALSLKLAAAGLLRAESPIGDPVVILDDVFAELDQSRRARLASAIADYEQVLITAAVEADVPPELAGDAVRIQSGRIVEEGS